jgi:methylphosphotriester-DNA--protein-cysteine methyltransferase
MDMLLPSTPTNDDNLWPELPSPGASASFAGVTPGPSLEGAIGAPPSFQHLLPTLSTALGPFQSDLAGFISNFDLGSPPSILSPILPAGIESHSPHIPEFHNTHTSEPVLPHSIASGSGTSPPPYSTADERWEAVLSRDPLAAGHFLYCVMTTLIYCRPTCAARRPSRANVEFVLTPAEAEALGCGPCKRCKPRETEDPAERRRNDAIEQLKTALLEGEVRVTVKSIAEELGISMWHLNRLFKKKVGQPPQQWAQEMRRKGAGR